MTQGTVLITGASAGIGAVYADRFAKRGHDLILVARNKARLDAVAADLTHRHRVSVRVVEADLTARAGLAEVEAILKTDASITHLVNNAGFGSAAPLAASSAEDMERMIAINVTALMRLTYAAVPAFTDRGRGTVINIASVVAVAPEMLNGVYGGSKAFVLGFSQSLRKELNGTGVAVQVVLPGVTRTEFWDLAGLPLTNLPKEIVMSTDDLVDSSLAGLDRGEFATVPGLQDVAEWNAWEAARATMQPHLSNANPAPRYRAG